MRLLLRTFQYRLKMLCTGAFGILCLTVALGVAMLPFIGLIMPDALIPIGWIDEDKTDYSQRLLDGVNALDVVWVLRDDEDTLTANLQTGRLEAVFVVKKGFEAAMKSGRYKNTLVMLRSPYSTAAGVISESVGSAAMQLWLTCSAANEARALGGEALYAQVFEDAAQKTDDPILRLMRSNEAGQMQEAAPLLDAAKMSLRLLAAVAGFFMLTGMTMPRREKDFFSRLYARGCTAERYRLAAAVSDAAFMLPCVAVPLFAFWLAGEAVLIWPYLALFALYLLAFGGIAALTSKLRAQASQLMLISFLTISNVMIGGLLMPLPSSGQLFDALALLLPARWLSSAEAYGFAQSFLGLGIAALAYNVLPFVLRRRRV